jgi:hypothetical protein
MWVEVGAGQGSFVHFCAASTLEASLVSILEATAEYMELFSLYVRQIPTC